MSDERELDSASEQPTDAEDIDAETYVMPGYVVENEPIDEDWDANETFARQAAASTDRFYAPRPFLGRGFDANTDRPSPQTVQQLASYNGSNQAFSPSNTGVAQPSSIEKKSRWSWLLHKPKAHPQNTAQAQHNPLGSTQSQLGAAPNSSYPPGVEAAPQIDPITGLEVAGIPTPVAAPKLWEKQPYKAIAHISAIAGTLTTAWLLGILAAQLVPGNIKRPPLQESVLRKTSRFASGLWHLPQLWKTPPTETRIEAIPLPETGPILAPIKLSPVERQPLIDELNAVETELITLDRRIETLEKRLGKPPYQNADIENRISGLRGAIDPPVRAETTAQSQYEPTAQDPQDALLAVAKHKIMLPSDAVFAPGDSSLKDSEMLNQVLDQLVNYPEATVIIRSYSDDQAGAIATRKYTLAQAIELSEYLSKLLPKGYRWVTIGGGQSQPIEPNDSAINRQRNRRIEILVDTR